VNQVIRQVEAEIKWINAQPDWLKACVNTTLQDPPDTESWQRLVEQVQE
jgi:hypothetical protein